MDRGTDPTSSPKLSGHRRMSLIIREQWLAALSGELSDDEE